MRVISGTARGRKLEAPRGMSTRPTTDMVKEAIFSSVQFSVPGAKVLDLFSGSGRMGIECLSRGAVSAVFVDADLKAIDVIKKNLKTCSLFDKSRVVNMQAEAFLATCKDKFDMVFLDPPYNKGILEKIIEKVYQNLSEGGIIIAESELGWKLDKDISGLCEVKVYKYGKIQVTKFIKE